MYLNAASATEKPAETRYILMYPNGEWKIEFNPPANQQQFYKSTVDKLLSDYVNYRFSEIPQTIRSDFAKATLFLGAQQRSWFMNEDGFNAIDLAGAISTSKNPDTKRVNVLFFDHQDSVTGVFDAGAKTKKIIRTNIYIEEVKTDKYGSSISKPVRKIINLTWTLASEEQLNTKKRKYFLVNPIGLTILTERETIDRGAYLNK